MVFENAKLLEEAVLIFCITMLIGTGLVSKAKPACKWVSI
jgi:hypothetical protein